MPIGAGKYDDLCTTVREEAQAVAAFVIIVEGNRGSGFSVQCIDENMLRAVPDLLENVASEIRRSLREDTN